MKNDLFVTILGSDYFFGTATLARCEFVLLVKEPNNTYDPEAIRVEIPFAGTAGYIANSPGTRAKNTMSAGRVYDSIGDISVASIEGKVDGFIIAKVRPEIDEISFSIDLKPQSKSAVPAKEEREWRNLQNKN